MGVAVLSALTVFLFLFERDHSLLTAASGQEYASPVNQPTPQRGPIVQADTQPAPDTITRVTVPTAVDHQHSPVAAAAQALPIEAASQGKPSGATSDDSETAVAKSHSELVALEKRGVRRYVEFTLARTRHLQRVGPVSVGVWKIDTRRKIYDLSVIADSRRIERKHVALYSPVRIASSEFVRPIEFVVNSIDRDGISGYISEPKNTR